MISNGIALIPDHAGLRELVRIQQAVRDIEPLQPILGEAEYLPHITLLQGISAIPLGNVGLLEALAATISTMQLQISVATVSYISRGWYFLEVQPMQQLRILHDMAFWACKEFLIPPSFIEPAALEGYTSSQMDNFTRFGYRYIGDDFRPHVTIGRTGDRHISRHHAELQAALCSAVKALRFAVSTVSSYRMGINGGHLDTIAGISVSR